MRQCALSTAVRPVERPQKLLSRQALGGDRGLVRVASSDASSRNSRSSTKRRTARFPPSRAGKGDAVDATSRPTDRSAQIGVKPCVGKTSARGEVKRLV